MYRIIYLLILIPFITFADQQLIRQLKNTQDFLKMSEERFPDYNLNSRPRIFDDGSQIIFRPTSKSGQADAEYRDISGSSYHFKIDSINLGNIFIDQTKNEIINIENFGDLVVFNLKKKLKIECGQFAGAEHFTKVGEEYVFSKNEYGIEQKTNIYKLELKDDKCSVGKIIETRNKSSQSFRLFDIGGDLGIVQEQSVWGEYTNTGSLQFIIYNLEGLKKIEQNYPELKPSQESIKLYPSPSVRNNKLIIPLSNVNDSDERTHLYLIDQNLKPMNIYKNILSAHWLDDRHILVNKATHSKSSELYILDLVKNFKETKIEAPNGLKNQIFFGNGKVFFENRTHERLMKNYQVDIQFKSALVAKDIDSDKKSLTGIKIPITKEVSYQSGDHRVASFLNLPKDGCNASEKLPLIVYLHGGSYSSGANKAEGDSSDYLLFSQLGWPVLEAGYYGDKYHGEEYNRGGERYIDKDRYTKTLQDIQAAGEFARTIPCVDPKKIILLGHSHGAMISNLYVTEPLYKKNSPFAGIIIRNGITADEDIQKFFFDKQNIRVAVKNGEQRNTSSGYESADVPIFHPTQQIIGVQDALDLLDQINKVEKKYYGVLYKVSDETIHKISPMRRAKNVMNKNILIVATDDASGATDPTLGPKNFEQELKKYSNKIEGWYPNEIYRDIYKPVPHLLSGDIEVQFILKVKDWVGKLK